VFFFFLTLNSGIGASQDAFETRITSNSTQILSRKRRFFLPRTDSWRFRVIFDCVIPIEDNNGGPLTFRLPVFYDVDSGRFTGAGRRSFEDRSFKSGEDHRTSTLLTLERYLNRMGGVVGNGHACVLRAICEVAETPVTADGFLGDLVSTILVPSYSLDSVNGTVFNETDYTQAQKDGYFGDGCSHYHEDCPVSLFQYVESEGDDPGYYISQYIGSTVDSFTNDYPAYADIYDPITFLL